MSGPHNYQVAERLPVGTGVNEPQAPALPELHAVPCSVCVVSLPPCPLISPPVTNGAPNSPWGIRENWGPIRDPHHFLEYH